MDRSGIEETLLEKLLEMFSSMPDEKGEDPNEEKKESPLDELAEGGDDKDPGKGSLEVLSIDAKPKTPGLASDMGAIHPTDVPGSTQDDAEGTPGESLIQKLMREKLGRG